MNTAVENKTEVRAWHEAVTIPTYEPGEPEKAPIFLEKRVYQGSSGVVYPYPVIESVSDVKTDHTYNAIWMENEYIKVMILPELGGRVQMAYDKIRQRHFIYYNHVIKPALVGLAGPWISGGIEFNWPQHHRPSTFMPVDTSIEQHPDGSVTVWVSEVERMFHQKGMAGFTLRPGCAFLEIKGVVYNPTPMPQTFLWWANPAVAVNDHYQSVFPPDVNAVFDHGKRAVSTFPIATGEYYKMDYSAGVDISNYRNIKVPTSYMVAHSDYDFEGGYENDTQAGMLHVANHRVSPGKKQWTWGNGDFGQAWDRNLTDEDGPYIELMAGVYTENQPDFSWLQPYEEKSFTQYFMPYRELGMVKNACRDLIMNVEPVDAQTARLKLLATSRQRLRVVVAAKQSPAGQGGSEALTDGQDIIYDEWQMLSPEDVFVCDIDLKGHSFEKIVVKVMHEAGRLQRQGRRLSRSNGLLSFNDNSLSFRDTRLSFNDTRLSLNDNKTSPRLETLLVSPPFDKQTDTETFPEPAQAALQPGEIRTNEQLYLTGLHLEQYRHATFNPVDYYEEALRRDPQDIRCNNAMGLWLIRHGRFDKAEPYLRTAVRELTRRNPNPYDGEPLYNLGLSLRYQALLFHTPHLLDEAYDMFYKSTWNAAWQDAGYLACAQISVTQGRYEDALDELEHCLSRNWHNHKARALKAAVMRRLCTMHDAQCAAEECEREENVKLVLDFVDESLELDRFNYGCLYERYLLTHDEADLASFKTILRRDANNYDEVALDYQAAGLEDEALSIWQTAVTEGAVSEMTRYYCPAVGQEVGHDVQLAFPNRLEAVVALQHAIQANEMDARASYLLGCLYYDKRQYALAVVLWEMSSRADGKFPYVWRNLALAYFNKHGDAKRAVECMERAYSLATDDARLLMELDQLYKRLRRSHQQRLDLLLQHPDVVERRDDLVLERVTLLNLLGRYEEAKDDLDRHTFHPWEGGEGKVPAQYQLCRVELAKKALANGLAGTAVEWLTQCLSYPHHLGEGKLYGAQENDFYYFLAVAHRALGNEAEAARCLQQATLGPCEPAAALYYNDAKPDKIFYQGLALRALGREDEACVRFNRLLDYGRQHLDDEVRMDYFAVSLPDLLVWEDSLTEQNRTHCRYLMALGHYGLGDKEKAQELLQGLLTDAPNHLGVHAFATFIQHQ